MFRSETTGRPRIPAAGKHRAVEINNKLWVSGGGAPDSDMTDFLDKDDIWTQGPTMPFFHRGHAKVAISDHQVYVFGGVYHANFIYDDLTQGFTNKAPYNFVKVSSGAARMTLDGRDVVIALPPEGDDRVEVYDIKDNYWKIRDDLRLPYILFNSPTVVIDNR